MFLSAPCSIEPVRLSAKGETLITSFPLKITSTPSSSLVNGVFKSAWKLLKVRVTFLRLALFMLPK